MAGGEQLTVFRHRMVAKTDGDASEWMAKGMCDGTDDGAVDTA